MSIPKVIDPQTPQTVDLEKAQQGTSAYRESIVPLGIETIAFFIRIEDLLGALQLPQQVLPDDYSLTGIRVYMAKGAITKNTTYNHLYVVATDQDRNDIVQDSQGASQIYDMTWPCPDLCSTENVLTGPRKQKIRIGQKDA